MAEIKAIVEAQKVIAQLRAKSAKAIKDANVSVVTGYTTSYAIYVHENLEAKHKAGKQAKYLEAPAHVMASAGMFGKIIRDAVMRGMTIAQGCLLAMLRLQRESQLLVPVDTGMLRNSAFTTLE